MEMKKNDNPNPDDFYEPEQVHKSRRDREYWEKIISLPFNLRKLRNYAFVRANRAYAHAGGYRSSAGS